MWDDKSKHISYHTGADANGHHFADDMIDLIFFNEIPYIFIQISLNSVLKGPSNDISTYWQIDGNGHYGKTPIYQ